MSITLNYVLTFSSIIPVIVGLAVFSRLSITGRYVVLIMLVNFFTEVASILYAKFYGNNMVVYYLYVSFLSVSLWLYFKRSIEHKIWGMLFLIVPLLAFLEGMINGFHQFNSISFTTLNFITIGFCLALYLRMISTKVDRSLFYFNGVMLCYAMSATFFFFIARYLQSDDLTLMKAAFDIHSWINFVTNLAYALSIWTLTMSYSTAD